MLEDQHGRKHSYLRISLTDKCNLRCNYCMPHEDMQFMPSSKLLSADEIYQVALTYKDLGVERIRLTGGEPMVRKDFDAICAMLAKLDIHLSVTTNAYFLDKHLSSMKDNNVMSLNISLDTLDPVKFEELTRRDHYEKVMQNILTAAEQGFTLKLNMVAIKGWNDDELVPMLEFAASIGASLRFIEFMPFKDNNWDYSKVLSRAEILEKVGAKHSYEELETPKQATAKLFEIPSLQTTFGIISTVTEPFCDGCNRIRVTADGKIKNCLFDADELDLLAAMRADQPILPIIKKSIFQKHEALGGKAPFTGKDAPQEYQDNRAMIAIGG